MTKISITNIDEFIRPQLSQKSNFLPPRRGRIKVGGKMRNVHPHPNLPPS